MLIFSVLSAGISTQSASPAPLKGRCEARLVLNPLAALEGKPGDCVGYPPLHCVEACETRSSLVQDTTPPSHRSMWPSCGHLVLSRAPPLGLPRNSPVPPLGHAYEQWRESCCASDIQYRPATGPPAGRVEGKYSPFYSAFGVFSAFFYSFRAPSSTPEYCHLFQPFWAAVCCGVLGTGWSWLLLRGASRIVRRLRIDSGAIRYRAPSQGHGYALFRWYEDASTGYFKAAAGACWWRQISPRLDWLPLRGGRLYIIFKQGRRHGRLCRRSGCRCWRVRDALRAVA